MSTVYLAEHKRLHTKWAVKEVRKQQTARFDFLAESNILKRLHHPMLPRIVDIFEDGERILIVEDFVEGITLDDLLKQQKRVEEELGLQWFRNLCDVLGYLHNQQPHPIIYRDMKPSNVMLQPDGSLKLIDFGIAREYKQESAGDTTYVGTKGYAAPEQFGKAQTDARTDIYALGVTMYYLLTGKSPYEHPYQFVPARQLAPELSRGIEYILDKCIQPEPINRYQSVDELLDDLDHIYRFDNAWKRYQNAKRLRITAVLVLLSLSVGLMFTGQRMIGQEREAAYASLLSKADEQYMNDYAGAVDALDQARKLFPDRIDADRQQTYILARRGEWQACIDHGTAVLQSYGEDVETRLFMATAQFELGDYEAAAEGFAQGGELSADNLRDQAVCLGRLGQIDQARQILNDLEGRGAHPDATLYVQGEVSFAQGDFSAAEEAFLNALEQAETDALTRRCYVSLSDVYRQCAALARTGESPIQAPATKSAKLLAQAVAKEGLQYDSTLWESLALAYFESFHTDPSAPPEYLSRAAECFERVISLGITKEYLYSNLYTIYYEQKDFDRAKEVLQRYEAIFPDNYMPHALRGMLLITLENEKPQSQRDYRPAQEEYRLAGQMIRSSDETSYYQQLGSLIQNLEKNGWL